MSMTVSSSTPYTYTPPTPQVQQGVSDVTDALDSGDLSGAQSAFKSLAQVASPNPNSPLAPGIKQLTDALKSGDLAGAQDALASLQEQAMSLQSNIMQPYNASGLSSATTDSLMSITA